MFIDETGLKTNLTRLRGWTFGGDRLVEAVPAGRWETCTLVHAIALDGTRAAMVLDGPVNSVSFVGFCEWLLAPALHSGDIVVMDNLNSHKSERVQQIIGSVGAHPVYLPPYSPDLNPIEMVFAKLKQQIRRQKPRTFTKIVDATQNALEYLQPAELHACYEHCGYMTA